MTHLLRWTVRWGRRPHSISAQLLVVVNTVLGLAIVCLLIVRYSNELKDEIDKKQGSLRGRAIA